ncbi:MAG: hypothetical protein LBI92_09520 [Azoarcus sp.]|nr:hypothetical protein [Azoarcus sp.]
MNFRATLILGLSSLALLGGCATSRSVLDIPPPEARAAAQATGGEVFIVSVTDRRAFETAPRSPDIPSLDPGRGQDGAIKARAVGRKRNSFGRALGDILLKEGQSVETLTASSIRQAFAEKGYKVIDRREDTTPNTLFVDASVDKFWSWMTPGFSALTLSTEISTDLAIQSPAQGNAPGKTVTASIRAYGNYQTGMEGNWIEVINKALRAYIDELKAKLE